MKTVKTLAALSLTSAAIFGTASAASATAHEKVTICHRTNSDKNPYVLITVSAKAVDGEGKNDHTHHVVDEQHPRADIIPAPYDDVQVGDDEEAVERVYYCPSGSDTPGTPGPEGPAGPAGPAGPTGADGINGLNGADGKNGNDGAPGAAGKDGSAGAAGLTGADGPAGPVGGETPVPAVPHADPAPITELPHTGSGSAALAMLGGLLVVGGGGLYFITRRRNVA